ncbi:MAG: protein rep [Ignavibacterium sp.]|nr:protein rep [Ignavibacterium sp.]
MLKDYVEKNHPEDEIFIKNMVRQIKCTSALQIYDDDLVRSFFCNQKTCLVCNSIRLAKFLDKYLDKIDDMNHKYHLVLSIRNPGKDDLKQSIDSMYKFFNQSSIKKNKEFVELNKKIIFIRSFETTFNVYMTTYHIHFHCLLAGENETEVKRYGEIMLDYWLKYFGDKADRKAQYLEPQEKSLLENFKYLFKLKDITPSSLPMVYHLLKVTKGKNLFWAKNIKLSKLEKELKESKIKDDTNNQIIQRFFYKNDLKNWIDPETGELFIDDQKENRYKEDIKDQKNYRELQKFFRKQSIDQKENRLMNRKESKK